MASLGCTVILCLGRKEGRNVYRLFRFSDLGQLLPSVVWHQCFGCPWCGVYLLYVFKTDVY